jgi:LmbE family N-acetylglucosaminyl deacetylase
MLLFAVVSSAWAQPPVQLQQAFLDLSHDEVLMDLSAHPDDEDGAALALYRMKYAVKTYSILFTRGEGGQNEKGPELYEDLGVLRSEETRAAGKILGTSVFFLNLVDFGYSKTASETFRKWGGQSEVLRRLVYAIRKFKPDVIFTNHNTIDGHGQHQAVAVAAIAAFDAAADSTVFPEQLSASGLRPWQTRKLFFREFVPSGVKPDVVNDIHEVDPLRKKTYAEIAMEALRNHKTQGLDRIDVRRFARRADTYKLVRANSLYDRDSTSFFGGIDLWRDPAMAAARALREPLSSLTPDVPVDALLPAISRLQVRIDSLRVLASKSPLAQRVLGDWQSKLEAILRLALGIEVSLNLGDSVMVPRQRVACTLRVVSPKAMLGTVRTQFELPLGWAINESVERAPDLGRDHFGKEYTLIVGDSPRFTLPKRTAQYAPIGEEQTITAHVAATLGGYPIHVTVVPRFEVAPFMILTVEPRVVWMPRARLREGKDCACTVTNYLPHKTAGRIACLAPSGWRTEGATFVMSSEDSAVTTELHVTPPPDVQPGDYPLIVKTDYWSDEVTVRVSDAALSRPLLVGIVKSYDNTLESAIRELGADFKDIQPENLEKEDLLRYTTIIIDIRAYLVREDLQRCNERLLDYVKQGGNLVVMYQRENEWKPAYAPYRFRIGARRVTDEDAPVRILLPDHPLFNRPNTITAADWQGWKQERGVYFPTDVAQEYLQLVSTHDPDETPLTTGYLVATYGRGTYIYSSLVWYRELRELHAGAMRCFANMISYPAFRK